MLPAHDALAEKRKAIMANWMKTANLQDAQGEIVLAADVRYFAQRLPPVLTDREQLTTEVLRHLKTGKSPQPDESRAQHHRDEHLSR